MKNFTILLALLTSFALSAAIPTYKLTSSSINIGKLAQGNESTAVGTFLIERSSKTPDKAELHFTFSEYYSFCTKHVTQQIWVPADFKYVCHTQTYNGQTYTHCYNQHIPGHYIYQKVCVEYDYASTPEEEKIKLDFDKAQKLSSSQKEIFKVTVKQSSFTSDNFDVTIEPVSASVNYEISKKGILFKDSMSFKFKAL